MKRIILALLIGLVLVACEQATEPVVESPRSLDGWWKFEFVTYEYMDQQDVVIGQFELRGGLENLIGVLVHDGIPYAIIGVEAKDGIILSALAQTERMVFYVQANAERMLLTGHVELLHFYGTYWSTRGCYPVKIQRK